MDRSDPRPPRGLGLALGLVALFAALVPAGVRARWRAEWRAELWYAHRLGRLRTSRALGALPHAVALRWQESRPEMFLFDLRQAIRQLTHAPGFSAIVVLTLGIGIGANSLVYGILQSTVLQPLGSIDAERLVYLWRTHESGRMRTSVGLDDIELWRESAEGLDEVHVLAMQVRHLSDPVEPGRHQIGAASPGFFAFLGVKPYLGRTFAAEEGTEGQDDVVLLGFGLWQTAFGADEGIVGTPVRIDDRPHTVIGVLPRGFGLQPPHAIVRAWVPLVPSSAPRGVTAVARVAPGTTVEVVNEQLRALGPEDGPMTEWHGHAETPQERVGSTFAGVVWSFQGAVLLVLLIAGANTANLLLARGSKRRRELAVRSALGAGRGRLVRQLLIESLLLSMTGGLVGLALTLVGLRVVESLRPNDLQYFETLRVDASVLVVTAGLAVGCGVLFGLIPALQTSGHRLLSALAAGGRSGSDGAAGNRVRSGLVVAEVALSTLLLIGAGLLISSFLGLTATDPGYEADDVLAVRVALPASYEEDATARARFWPTLRERLETALGPGADSVAIASGVAPRVGITFGKPAPAEGEPVEPEAVEQISPHTLVSPQLFDALGMRFLDGAPVKADTDATSIVISETLAKRLWGQTNVTGREITGIGEAAQVVVGVVPDVRAFGLDSDRGAQQIYQISKDEDWYPTTWVVVRAAAPLSLVATVRNVVEAMEPGAVLEESATARELLGDSIALQRFNAELMAGFAVVALALALVGIYGVLSYSVARRIPELGVRMALGATAGAVLRLIGRQGAMLLGAGLTIGLVAAVFASRLLSSQLYGVEGFDPVTYLLVAIVLGGVGLAACALPAWRATRVDPLVALRAD